MADAAIFSFKEIFQCRRTWQYSEPTITYHERRQPQMIWTSHIDEEKAETRDESTTNAALILLLQGVSDCVKYSTTEGVFDHPRLKLKVTKGSFSTWTDGALRHMSHNNTLAIVEAKKRKRSEQMRFRCKIDINVPEYLDGQNLIQGSVSFDDGESGDHWVSHE